MKILLISPMVFPITGESKYAGIERLVWEYSRELVKNHDVTVMGHRDSIYPDKVNVLRTAPVGDGFVDGELQAYKSYHYLLRTFDVIHDFSHQHFACRYNYNLPAVNPFWHAPGMARYPKAPYNIVGLSRWAVNEFKRVYTQDARYIQEIVIDTDTYKPNGVRGDRFLTIGRMSKEKGNLAVVMLCKELGLPLDVAGGSSDADYEKAVRLACDGEVIKYHGEVDDNTKIQLMQTCKALVYAMPVDYAEVTSHKVQEAMLCGAPVIVSNVGAVAEIITNGVDGFLCSTEKDFKEAMTSVDKLNPDKTRERLIETYSVGNVVKQHLELYEKVANGERWK